MDKKPASKDDTEDAPESEGANNIMEKNDISDKEELQRIVDPLKSNQFIASASKDYWI